MNCHEICYRLFALVRRKKIYKVDDLYNNFLLYFEISELVTSSSLFFYFPAN